MNDIMNGYSVAIVSSAKDIISEAIDLCENHKIMLKPVAILPNNQAMELIHEQSPEIILLDDNNNSRFNDSIIAKLQGDWNLRKKSVLVTMDSWSVMTDKLAKYHRLNLVSVVPRRDFSINFSHMLDLMAVNTSLLFPRASTSSYTNKIKGTLIIGTDILNTRIYSNLISQYLHQSGILSHEHCVNVRLVLFELLMNALEHGSCNISYKEKNEWLKTGSMITALIESRIQEPENSNKVIKLHYSISPDSLSFIISDQGPGFDWNNHLKSKRNDDSLPASDKIASLQAHGYGIAMAKLYSDHLKYNRKGNKVMFKIFPKSTDNTQQRTAAGNTQS